MLEDNFHVGRLEWNVQRPVRLVPGAVGVVQPGGDDFRRRNVIDVGAEAIFGKVEPRQEGGEVFVRYDGHQDGAV